MRSRHSRWLFVLSLLFFGSVSCSNLFYFPDRDLHYLPSKLGFKAQETIMRSPDGTALVGWTFLAPQQPAQGTIIQFHGNAENMSSHYLALVWLVERGYNLFVFDYRGYGKSGSEPDPEGIYHDGLTALDQAWVIHKKSGARHFIVVGQSLGGAIAMRSLQDFKYRADVALVVLDSTFMSYKTVARRTLARQWWTWPMSPLGALLVSDEFAAEEAVKTNPTPLVLIHDEHDPSVPYSCGEDIFEAATAPKELWTLNQSAHIAAFSPANTEIREKFIRRLRDL